MKPYSGSSLIFLLLLLIGIEKIHAGRTNFQGRSIMGPRIATLLDCIESGKLANRKIPSNSSRSQNWYSEANDFRKKYENIMDYAEFVDYARQCLSRIKNQGFVFTKYTSNVRKAIVDYCILVKQDVSWPEEYKGSNIPLYEELHGLFYAKDKGEICSGFADNCGGTDNDRALEGGVECTDLLSDAGSSSLPSIDPSD